METLADIKTRWSRMEPLFHRAIELPAQDRTRLAREWCADDTKLLVELLDMLDSYSAVEQSMLSTPSTEYNDLLARKIDQAAEESPWEGKAIGPYRIDRLLGRGGMGVVYLAHRVSGGLTQTVAIKLMAGHLSAGPAVQQFLRERDALAKLEHPNIARLIDAGVTVNGSPYIAMEYIEGRTLDQLIEDPAISLQQKLRLMIDLCEAVGYVHRNLILHRDLKPSNVMVTDDGVLKVLDFGTLKLLGATAGPSSEMTQAGMRPLTLRYASPEHVQGKPVSTASDVYSLGMILYRMLAGRLPAAVQDLSILERSHDARTDRLEPPSRHHTSSGSGLHSMRDLDAITLKAISFEPERRYTGADEFALDLRRCLEQRPVSAVPDTPIYLATQFYRRNRLALWSVAAAVLVLGIGLAVARHEASLATTERQRAEGGIEEERKLAHMLLFTYFEDLRNLPASTNAQKQAATEAIRYLDQLAAVTTSPQLELDIVQGYRRMGLLMGSPYEANLGEAQEALQTLEKARTLARHLVSQDSRSVTYRVALMSVDTATAQAYMSLRQPQQALSQLMPAAEIARRVRTDPQTDWKADIQCAAVFKTMADTYGQFADARTQDRDKQIQALRESGAFYQAATDAHATGNWGIGGRLIIEMELGILYEEVDVDRAIASYRDGLAVLASLPPDLHNVVGNVRTEATIRTKLGRILLILGRPAEARSILRLEHERALRAVAADPIDTRARDDLIAYDSSTLEGLDPARDEPEIRQLLREYLETTEYLTSLHPQDQSWRFVHADALLKLAAFYWSRGEKRASAPFIARGLPAILSLASLPDADAETSLTAAKALLIFHQDSPADAQLAERLARQAIMASHPESAEELITLAEAQGAEGLGGAESASLTEAMQLLLAQPTSLGNAAKRQQIQALLQKIQHTRSNP